jgi:hypothetical protein
VSGHVSTFCGFGVFVAAVVVTHGKAAECDFCDAICGRVAADSVPTVATVGTSP